MVWRKSKNKGLKNRAGFTLTEVLVGVLVLSTAIVATSNFLVSMIHSNTANTKTLQAYYYSQEGLEAFRNMRDTHFMHNVNFKGSTNGRFWDSDRGFLDGGEYTVGLNVNPASFLSGNDNVSTASPWILSGLNPGGYENVKFYKSVAENKETEFKRSCAVEDFDGEGDLPGDKAVKVTCTTSWEGHDGVSLSMILTDWKDD